MNKKPFARPEILIWVLAVFLLSGGGAARSAGAEEFAPTRKVSFEINFDFLLHGLSRSIYFVALVPQTDRFRQTVDVDYSIEPDHVFSDGMTRYAVWYFQEPPDSFPLSIKVDAEIRQRDLKTIRAGERDGIVEEGDLVDTKDLAEFLLPEKWIECDDVALVGAAKNIPDGDDEIAAARGVFDFVRRSVMYGGYNATNRGAKRTFAKGSGDCTDYSDLFVALMRAKKIPARVVSGWVIDWTEGTSGKHNWAEFYSRRYGWVPVDVLLADQGRATFDTLPNMFVYFTQKRNDDQNPDFSLWRIKSLGDRVTVEAECRVLSADGGDLPEASRW